MNLVKIIILVLILVFSSFKILYAENHDTTEDNAENSLGMELETEEDVPLNDPFAGNEGTNSMSNMPEGEQEDEMSLYNFKLAGLISGKDHSYISVVSSAGEAITLTLGQYLGKNQFIDLRLTEAIFKKEDGKYLILDFNNQIREADDY